ncbi:hypothetical protein SMGD1_2147 [Sulfurimonas gotlandica GD1]|uniref:Lipoprotein n=1 Tax=Sulfurimonas gotlandica (strain DSM 19862 / JCM 16533 / GD1) TaxID=929558 RepID=B6BN53_SULGG|nr:hypothetical protein [Sulfurimonas gotlandica]EDZ61498.1 hypothetical protein CBGD1_1577 [Sulfurimonas gotlandica GD1]EHP30670.1 hypothetical protein SMGD1_2147 [Sulfurimonas gotlandica GD1]
MKKLILFLIISGIVLFLAGCGAGGPKIVIPSYTAPKEAAKLSKIETKDEFISDGAYLAVWLNPDVKDAKKTNAKLEQMLIDSVKAKFTETNFVTIDPLGDEKGVSLSMSISNYDYKSSGSKISLALEVTFILSRGTDEFLVKKYSDRKNRQSSDSTKLPTENELASQAVSKVVKYFISDISPLKTNQLREFKSLPQELSPVIEYAQRKNYKGAIKLMNNYKGKKDMNYHYDLAILYEAQASVTEDLKLLKYAESNYEEAMALGGINDKLVVSAKARFDNFYELLGKTKKQDFANQALRNDRDSMAGSSDSEYK